MSGKKAKAKPPAKESPGDLIAGPSASEDQPQESDTTETDFSANGSDEEFVEGKKSPSIRQPRGSQRPPTFPPREKVVELAIQLVSSQIAAISRHESTTAAFRQVRQVLIDVADSLSRQQPVAHYPAMLLEALVENAAPQDEAKPLEANEMFAVAARALREMRPTEEWLARPGLIGPLGNNDLDDLFMSAMHRVERMLATPLQSHSKVIYAEQIFEPSERLSENKIFQRLEEYGWPDLTGKESVVRLMAKVDAWFAAAFKDGPRTIPVRTDQATERKQQKEAVLLRRALRLCQEAGSSADSSSRRQYRDASESIASLLQARGMTSLDQLGNHFYRYENQVLILLIFGKKTPTPRPPKVPDSTKRQKASTYEYRPWAIFRYLRRYGTDDPIGIDLNRRLCAPLHALNPACTPDIAGLVPSEFEFGPLGREVDDFIAEQEAEDEAEWAEDYLDRQESDPSSGDDNSRDGLPADDGTSSPF